MKHSHWKPAALAVLMSMAVAAGCAQPQDTMKDARKDASKDSKSSESQSMLKIIDPELLAHMVRLASSSKICEVDHMTVCEIEMRTIRYPDNSGGKTYCVAIAPEVRVTTDPSGWWLNKKRIAWKLMDQSGVEISSLGGKELAFHEDAGIVITIDDPLAPQVDRRGQRGDGIGSALKWRFHTLTLRNKKDASATYLPVILWGPPQTAELCAAVDPKIVNI